MQQATDAQIQSAMQTSNPYMSLMSLTPQRTMPMSYAGPAGVTAANTNLGGFDSSIYNPAARTGLLTTPGAGVDGGGGVPGGAERGAGNDSDGTGQTFYGGLANLAGEANRRGFTGLGGFISGAIPTGSTYNRTDFTTGLPVTGTLTAADLAALSNYGGQPEGFTGADTLGGFGPATSGGMAKGGMVNMKPQRYNPPGPDDGYAALDNGEFVIRKSAVKKYGANIFEQINAGRIPAQRLKSLLE
jgi:hypothetical protein